MCKHSTSFEPPIPRSTDELHTHLSQNERYQIHTMLDLWPVAEIDLWPVAEIATRLGRHESTIRRELARNRGERGDRPKQAQVFADERSIGSRNAAWLAFHRLFGRKP